MNQYLLLYRSLTQAQIAARALQTVRIRALLEKAPRDMPDISCGYALRLGAGDYDRAISLLRARAIPPERTLTGFRGGREGVQ